MCGGSLGTRGRHLPFVAQHLPPTLRIWGTSTVQDLRRTPRGHLGFANNALWSVRVRVDAQYWHGRPAGQPGGATVWARQTSYGGAAGLLVPETALISAADPRAALHLWPFLPRLQPRSRLPCRRALASDPAITTVSSRTPRSSNNPHHYRHGSACIDRHIVWL